jgi:molybdopterin molybdotransferase
VVFGLPGNPVSAYVCAVRLAMRVLLRIQGQSPEPDWVEAPLAEALPSNGPREFYQPAVLREGKIVPLAWKGSGDIFTLAAAGLLLLRSEHEPAQSAGAMARAIRLP